VDLDVRKGEFISIIGPSGGGKTTLLRAIGGLLRPTRGTILVDDMSPEEATRHKSIGFVFQDPSLLPWRTVLGNIRLPLELNPAKNGGRAVLLRLLDTVGLSEFRDYHPQELSGGMRQRVALARALVIDPTVLLMDEPLGSLDEITRTAMRYELLRVWEETTKTVVLVTHSIPEAVMMSDTVAVLSTRPGHVVGKVSIDLPRPREESLEMSDRFRRYTDEIKRLLAETSSNGTPVLGEEPARG
jgi:NitT/TauT family transport system ATP-binding protein